MFSADFQHRVRGVEQAYSGILIFPAGPAQAGKAIFDAVQSKLRKKVGNEALSRAAKPAAQHRYLNHLSHHSAGWHRS